MKKISVTLLILICVFSINAQTKVSPEPPIALTNESIITLVKNGLNDKIIIGSIESNSCNFDVSADGLIKLSLANVSNNVIEAMVDKTKKLQIEASDTFIKVTFIVVGTINGNLKLQIGEEITYANPKLENGIWKTEVYLKKGQKFQFEVVDNTDSYWAQKNNIQISYTASLSISGIEKKKVNGSGTGSKIIIEGEVGKDI